MHNKVLQRFYGLTSKILLTVQLVVSKGIPDLPQVL